MKNILFMRHAKSDWSNTDLKDFDRVLNDRGQKDAPEMGKRLHKKKFRPDLIISSTAKRTMLTARFVAAELGYDETRIDLQADLYEADIEDVLHVIREIDDRFDQVIIIGHNPVFTDISGYLSGSFIENLPTAGMLLISFDIDTWKQVSRLNGRLEWFDYPRNTAH